MGRRITCHFIPFLDHCEENPFLRKNEKLCFCLLPPCRSDVDVDVLVRNVRIIVEGLARHMYNLSALVSTSDCVNVQSALVSMSDCV